MANGLAEHQNHPTALDLEFAYTGYRNHEAKSGTLGLAAGANWTAQLMRQNAHKCIFA